MKNQGGCVCGIVCACAENSHLMLSLIYYEIHYFANFQKNLGTVCTILDAKTLGNKTMRKRAKSQARHRQNSLASGKKGRIPASLKAAVWLKYNGQKFTARCFVSWCPNYTNVFNFEAGHDIPESKGGATNIDNLKPICACCNKSMGNKYTISEFSKKFNILTTSNGGWCSYLTRFLHLNVLNSRYFAGYSC